jgi:hypothetical protein
LGIGWLSFCHQNEFLFIVKDIGMGLEDSEFQINLQKVLGKKNPRKNYKPKNNSKHFSTKNNVPIPRWFIRR